MARFLTFSLLVILGLAQSDISMAAPVAVAANPLSGTDCLPVVDDSPDFACYSKLAGDQQVVAAGIGAALLKRLDRATARDCGRPGMAIGVPARFSIRSEVSLAGIVVTHAALAVRCNDFVYGGSGRGLVVAVLSEADLDKAGLRIFDNRLGACCTNHLMS